MNGWRVELRPGNQICAANDKDLLPAWGNNLCADLGTQTDVVVRLERDIAVKEIRLNVRSARSTWTATSYCGDKNIGTAGNLFPCPIGTVNLTTYAGPAVLGGANTAVRLAFLKWYSTLAPDQSIPPRSYDSTANLGDWRFEQTAAGLVQNINLSTSAAYVSTPIYLPVARARTQGAPSWSDWLSVRAGFPAKLDATASFTLTDSPPLAYNWRQVSGPSTLTFDSYQSLEPQITGLVFGTYVVELIVIDDLKQAHATQLTFGAVATDEHGVVVQSDPRVESILGPQIAFGQNPWSWADSRHQYLAEFFGGLLETEFAPFWRNFGPGTISATYNSPVISGSGTNFNSFMNCGPNGDGIVIRYQQDGIVRYVAYEARSCTATSITLNGPWLAQPGIQTLLSYAKWTQEDIRRWTNQSTNVNYYDNVLAHYSLYYRSGNTRYRDFARTLADRWLESPFVNRFEEIPWATRLNGAPRLRSFTGLVLRALDGKPESWPALRNVLSFDLSVPDSSPIADVREDAYSLQHLSLGAMFDPSSANRATYLAKVNSLVALRWTPQRRPGGYWAVPVTSPAGAATLVNGNREVTGTNFTPSTCVNWVLFGTDPIAYRCDYTSSASIALRQPYLGASGAKSYQAANLVGTGIQPFVLGIAGTAFRYAYLAAGNDILKDYSVGVAEWLRDFGYRAVTKGLYYGRVFVNCEPSPDSVSECADGGDGPSASRFLAGEAFGALASAEMFRPDSSQRSLGDTLYTVNFGRNGFSSPIENPEGYFIEDFADSGFVVSSKKAKDYGFFFGFGFAASWPAARLGGVQPFQSVTSALSINLPGEPAAARARITLISPSGSQSTQFCATETCELSLDARQGSHLVRIEYLDASDAVIPDRTLIQILDLPAPAA